MKTFHGRAEYADCYTATSGTTKVLAFTGTVQYDLWKNVLSRLEVRWDHFTSEDGGAYDDMTTGVKQKNVSFAKRPHKF